MASSILIIDDDERLRELLENYLTDKKFKVFTSGDFLIAKDILTYFIFDLIIIDRMMIYNIFISINLEYMELI